MQKFKSLNELTEAYKNKYNAGYSNSEKHLTAEEVLELKVYTLIPAAALVKYNVQISKRTEAIADFGYVAK